MLADLAFTKRPVSILHGRQDRLIPVGLARMVMRMRPSWRGTILASCGHIPSLEKPAETTAAIANFYAVAT